MRFAGIDIGSRAVKLVVVDEAGSVLKSARSDTGFDPMAAAEKLIDGTAFDRIMATGYGRSLFEVASETPTVTEIKAHACGARAVFPNADAVLDIGGQDSKAIALNETGGVRDFAMNDKCAAGTGRFLEVMARALEVDLDDFGPLSLSAENPARISSLCTVFAESEVISLIAKGARRADIIAGIHASVAARVVAMANRIDDLPEVVQREISFMVRRQARALVAAELSNPYPQPDTETRRLAGLLMGQGRRAEAPQSHREEEPRQRGARQGRAGRGPCAVMGTAIIDPFNSRRPARRARYSACPTQEQRPCAIHPVFNASAGPSSACWPSPTCWCSSTAWRQRRWRLR